MSIIILNDLYRRMAKDLHSVLKNHDGTQSPHERPTTAKDFDHALRKILTSKSNRLTAV
ncbi:MAG: hypothetical protein WCO61_06530 [Alphaproteobacteria bacterium]